VAETFGIGQALLLSGALLALSLFLLRVWIPELATIDRGHGDEPDEEADTVPDEPKVAS
jgi:hypothetical protein